LRAGLITDRYGKFSRLILARNHFRAVANRFRESAGETIC
jgi:hypothetical protein